MKVKIEIEDKEAQAYVELMKEAKVPAEVGYLLVNLRFKVIKAFEAEAKKQQAAEVKKDK